MAEPEELDTSALAVVVGFSASAVVMMVLQAHEWYSSRSRTKFEALPTADPSEIAPTPPKKEKKLLSQPLELTTSSVLFLTTELTKLGFIMLLIFTCEKRPIFPHAIKAHDMDTFWCMITVLAVACACNVRKGKSLDVLNREQTEEWKGWMQFVFLLYHYFSVHEVYNTVRVMITSYVWMTGFGNFSFFYLKSDFSLVRVLQMLWRLNFLVLLLCATLGNTYILYYICPLHTFYFLVVYLIMRIAPRVNHGTGIRWKLLIAAGIIYCVWDLDLGLFPKLFFFLGNTPKIGATSGTMWEWYFRTSLDHWSTLLGMVFALNFPVTMLWLNKVEQLPALRQWSIKLSAAGILVASFVWWTMNILTQPKLDYNMSNAYFGVAIPLLTYVFVRNLSPTLRIHYLEPLHSIGKITLETYLMQHHIWLTSNAKTVLTLIPKLPRVNLVVTGVLYVLVSKELYRITMSVRGVLLPDDRATCLRNLMGVATVTGLSALTAGMVQSMGLASFILPISFFMGGLVLVWLHLMLRARGVEKYDGKLLSFSNFGPALVAFLLLGGVNKGFSAINSKVMEPAGPNDTCLTSINRGHWTATVGGCDIRTAFCDSHAWEWVDVPDQCHFHFMGPSEVLTVTAGKSLVLLGDSTLRNTYHRLLFAYGAQAEDEIESIDKHTDQSWHSDATSTKVDFKWTPFIADVAGWLEKATSDQTKPDMIVMGVGLWDALHNHNLAAYTDGVRRIKAATVELAKQNVLTMWVVTTAVVDSLVAPEKKEWLQEKFVVEYRKTVEASGLLDETAAVLDGYSITVARKGDSFDGVHYANFVYDACIQVITNAASHYGWTGSKTSAGKGAGAAKHIGSMGSPIFGIGLITLVTIMLFSMDAYNGIPRLMLRLLGGGDVTWTEAYGPLLAKIGVPLPASHDAS